MGGDLKVGAGAWGRVGWTSLDGAVVAVAATAVSSSSRWRMRPAVGLDAGTARGALLAFADVLAVGCFFLAAGAGFFLAGVALTFCCFFLVAGAAFFAGAFFVLAEAGAFFAAFLLTAAGFFDFLAADFAVFLGAAMVERCLVRKKHEEKND